MTRLADPNSAVTRFRYWLARKIEPPGPAPGEAWCVGCSLNSGRTAVTSADGHRLHEQLHAGPGNTEVIVMRVNYPEGSGP